MQANRVSPPTMHEVVRMVLLPDPKFASRPIAPAAPLPTQRHGQGAGPRQRNHGDQYAAPTPSGP